MTESNIRGKADAMTPNKTADAMKKASPAESAENKQEQKQMTPPFGNHVVVYDPAD